MGENDTAGLDPIFFFHHCFVDRVFWLWQKKNGYTDKLDIIPQYPGTNSVDSQGPTPGTAANLWLTLDSPLDPFTIEIGGKERPYTSNDCINIETQLGYTYGPGSVDQCVAGDRIRRNERRPDDQRAGPQPRANSWIVSHQRVRPRERRTAACRNRSGVEPLACRWLRELPNAY
ncbi:hypothetical protein ABIF79_010950 [Bradyrhizobium japonicum]